MSALPLEGLGYQSTSRFQRLVRRWTRWAWPDATEAIEHYGHVRAIAHLKTLQLSMLEELFREKQAKIGRLQASYADKKRPLYEDLRKENYIRDAESLAQSISAMAKRAEEGRLRLQKGCRPSDGTVAGVPGDKPNVETGDGW